MNNKMNKTQNNEIKFYYLKVHLQESIYKKSKQAQCPYKPNKSNNLKHIRNPKSYSNCCYHVSATWPLSGWTLTTPLPNVPLPKDLSAACRPFCTKVVRVLRPTPLTQQHPCHRSTPVIPVKQRTEKNDRGSKER